MNFSTFAVNSDYSEAYSLFKSGQYQELLEKLEKMESSFSEKGLFYYWKGFSYNQLKEYPKAQDSLKKSLGYSQFPREAYYDFAQSLYAQNKLNEAEVAFSKSVKNKIKPAKSLYYLGYIRQLRENHEGALKTYDELLGLSGVKKNLKQAASFRKGIVLLIQGKREKVIPQFKLALNIDEKSELGREIRRKIDSLKRKKSKQIMNNGRPIPDKRYNLRFNLNSGYDSNVLLESDTAQSEATNKDALVLKGSLLGNYTSTLKKEIFYNSRA